MIVHALFAGKTLCQDKAVYRKMPCDWPEGHRWTYVEELGSITCEECYDNVRKGKEGFLVLEKNHRLRKTKKQKEKEEKEQQEAEKAHQEDRKNVSRP